MRKQNVVAATFTQTVPLFKKQENGEKLQIGTFVASPVIVENETVQNLKASEIGLWLLANLKKAIKLARLQGKKGFMLSKPIDVSLTINNKTEKMLWRFSVSEERLNKLIAETTPEMIAEFFTPVGHVKNSGYNLKYLTMAAIDAVIVNAIKDETKEEKKELPAPAAETPASSIADRLPSAMLTADEEEAAGVHVQDELQAKDNEPYVFAGQAGE